MANALYIQRGTRLKINGEALADYAFSVEGLANGAGRISAQIDLGADPRPGMYKWQCKTVFQATPTQGYGLDIYLAEGDDTTNTFVSGDEGVSDAALGDVDSVRNMRKIGNCIAENAAAGETNVSDGEVMITSRYVSIAVKNISGAAVNATDSNFIFYLTPLYEEVQ